MHDHIVVEGTSNPGLNDILSAKAGLSAHGSLLLELFGLGLNLRGSVQNRPPLGADGPTTFEFSGAGTASFRISGQVILRRQSDSADDVHCRHSESGLGPRFADGPGSPGGRRTAAFILFDRRPCAFIAGPG